MVRCIVKCCYNNTLTITANAERISFFRLPKVETVWEDWLREIGEVKMPPDIKDARICSTHFTEQSFATPTPGRPKNTGKYSGRRRLVPTAVPTLNLRASDRGSSDRPVMDFNVVRRTIDIPIPNPGLNRKRKLRNVKAEGDDSEHDLCQDLQNTREEETAKTTRLTTENFDETGNAALQKINQEDDPYKTIELLKAELQYHRSISEAHRNSKCDNCQEYKVFESVCATLGSEVKDKEDKGKKMLVENTELRRLNPERRAKLQTANKDKKYSRLEVDEMVQSVLKPYFTEGQISCIVEKCNSVKWSTDDYAVAISLQSISPKAYRYLRSMLNFPLPSLSSLRSWALHNLDTSEGFLTDILAVMRENSKTLSTMDKLTVLTFGEMDLNPEMCLDAKLEQLIGPCCKVQVIMVRGLFANWKQPIYYKFDQPMTKTILNEALIHLDQAGYQVVATTSDIDDKRVWGQLRISTDNHYFQHPSIKNAVVYVFADVPHLLKLLRNCLVDDGIFLHSCKEKFTVDIFQTLVNLSSAGELDAAHRVTQRVLDARKTLSRAVWPAAQIWSHSAGKAILRAGDKGLLKTTDYTKFADFVLTVNSWFDVQNSQHKYGPHPGVNGFGIDLDQQERVLLLMTSYIEHMRVGSQETLMPFQQGIIISNASLRGLYKFLKNKYPEKFEYLLTRRLQQDILENFFTHIRGTGTTNNPSGYEFRCRLRRYILGNNSQVDPIANRNTREDDNPIRLPLSSSSLPFNTNSQTVHHPSTPFSLVLLPVCEPEDQIPSQSYHIGNMLKNCNTSLRPEAFAIDYNCSIRDYEIEPDHPTEIILTQEIFRNIMNISQSELAEDLDGDSPESIAPDFDANVNDSDKTSGLQRIQKSSVTSSCQDTKDVLVSQECRLKYVAGYVAYRFQKKYRFLGKPNNQVDESVVNGQTDWTTIGSEDGIVEHISVYPSDILIDLAKLAEVFFTKFHGEAFSKKDQVVQKVVKRVKNSKKYSKFIPEEVLQCLVRTLTHMRVREMNKLKYARN